MNKEIEKETNTQNTKNQAKIGIFLQKLWYSVKISDTDFAEFPSIKSVSCSSMLPF